MPAPTYATAACRHSPVASLICALISPLSNRRQYTGVDDGSDEEGFRVNLDRYDLNNKYRHMGNVQNLSLCILGTHIAYAFHLKRAHTVAFATPAPLSAIMRYVLRHLANVRTKGSKEREYAHMANCIIDLMRPCTVVAKA